MKLNMMRLLLILIKQLRLTISTLMLIAAVAWLITAWGSMTWRWLITIRLLSLTPMTLRPGTIRGWLWRNLAEMKKHRFVTKWKARSTRSKRRGALRKILLQDLFQEAPAPKHHVKPVHAVTQ